MGTESYRRREAAAHQVELILRSNPSVHKSPLQIASYAAALSMVVAYRKLRDIPLSSRSPADIQSLADRCDILESFKGISWSAEAIARLGRKALRNIAELCDIQDHGPRSSIVAAKASHDASSVNALQVLSSAAESHAQGNHPNELAQTLAAEADPGNPFAMDEPLLEVQADSHDGGAAGKATDEFDPFQNLDTAFGDFFDLSTPTAFFDPLFDGVEAFDFSNFPE